MEKREWKVGLEREVVRRDPDTIPSRTTMSGYEYEAFYSYKRDVESDSWHEIVVSKLKFWLKKELSQTDVKIFFDVESIETADRWDEKIADGLKKSKCFVGLWSPDYFQSRWCLSEWRTFVERERKLEMKMGGLIIPARYHDGDSFPAEARSVQSVDLSDYNSTMPFFWQTQDAVDFEKKKLKAFAKDIARRIMKAPPYQADFPVVLVPESDIPPASRIGRVAEGKAA